MSKCNFTKELDRLRKSSSDSIDNVDRFDDFKRYMHVTRNVEEDLKCILREVNSSRKKTLVLLCGSAGDGKSHMLSYLKNADEDRLIENYIVYNDATESSEPSKTAIDTLNMLLDGFKDENLELPGKNVILAINLGVLSNFIESEYSNDYSLLKKYVEKNNILNTKINDSRYDVIENFQHVSFSDYHMFSLTESGISPHYIQQIMDKIFAQDDSNIFFNTYKHECSTCPLSSDCPVKSNYEFLMDEKCQQFIANKMVKVALVNKIILTTREILNYFYDVLVPQQFNKTKMTKLAVDQGKYMKEYFSDITPALMFEYDDITAVMNQIKVFDPLQQRSETADEVAVQYYVSSSISDSIVDMVKDTPYSLKLTNKNILDIIERDKVLKAKFFNIVIRINAMKNNWDESEVYKSYIRDLYYYNAGKKPKLGKVYTMVQESVVQWCGSESDGTIRLDDGQNGYVLYENIQFDPQLQNVPKVDTRDVLDKFVSELVVEYNDNVNNSVISLNIDYSLYELIYKLNEGYIQTADDRNNHADFISFISKIIKSGTMNKNIIIVSDDGQKAVLESSQFGFKFKVVK